MTIVALHHTDKDIFAIADGLISRGDERVISEDQKIVLFTPQYKIPHVSLGHFNYFSDYDAHPFGLAYAGNYTVVSTAIKRFTDIVTRLLVLSRDYEKDGKPTIYVKENAYNDFRSRDFDDSFNFEPNEFPPITVDFLMNILQGMTARACKDFATNAMLQPDVQFSIFGLDKIGHTEVNRCQILKCRGVAYQTPLFERFSALPWHLNCIGDARVIPGLLSTIETSHEYTTPAPLPPSEVRDYGLFDDAAMSPFYVSMRKEATQANWLQVRESVIEREVMSLINRDAGTIGGDCTIARSTWAFPLVTKTITHAEVRARHLID